MGTFTGSLGTLWVEIGARISEFEAGMSQFSKTLDSSISDAESKFRGLDKFGGIATNIGVSLTAAITAPIIGIGAVAIKASGDFDTAMRTVSARGEITGKDLQGLKQQAIDLGAATQFSSKQAADGMAEFAGAGFNAKQIFAAMPGTLNLAAAAQTSVGEAAKTVKDLLGQFGLAATDSQRAVDVLAKSSNESSGTLGEMANSLRYVGPVAKAAGLDIEQTSAALIVLDKAGIRGEQAGTSFRAMLASLQGPSKDAKKYIDELGIAVTDGGGKMLPFSAIIEQFKVSLSKIPNEADKAKALVEIFGRESLAAANILTSQGSPALLEFEDKLRKAGGTAEAMKNIVQGGMGGALEKMKGSVETAAQSLGDVLAPSVIAVAGFIESGANKLSEFAQWFTTLPGPVQGTALAIVGFAAALGPALVIAGQLAFAITSLATVAPLVGSAFTALSGVVAGVTASMVLYTGGVAAAVIAIGYLVNAIYEQEKAYKNLEAVNKTQASSLKKLEDSLRSQGGAVDELKDKLKRGQITQAEYEKGLRDIGKAIGDAKKASGQIVTAQTKQTDTQDELTKKIKAAQDALKKNTAEQKGAIETTGELHRKDAILWETARQLEAQYKKNITELVNYKLAHESILSRTPQMIQAGEDLNKTVDEQARKLVIAGGQWSKWAAESTAAMTKAVVPLKDLEDAYKQLGIKSAESLDMQAERSKQAYEKIKASGTATARDLDQAWVAYEKARIDAAIANGEEIPRRQLDALKKMEDQLDQSSTKQKSAWDGFGKQISTGITNLSQDLVKTLFEDPKSFGEMAIKGLKNIGQAVALHFVEPAMKAISEFISGAITDLLSGRGLGGVLDRLSKIGDAILDIFGGASSAAGGAAGAVGAAGSAAGSAGGAAGSAGSAAASGLAGIVGAVGSVVTAVSSIIANFQLAKQETTLNAIEESTRYVKIWTGEQPQSLLWCAQKSTEYIGYIVATTDSIGRKLDDWLSPLPDLFTQSAEALAWAVKRLDQIGDSVTWGSEADKRSEALLSEILSAIQSRTTQVSIVISGAQSPTATASAVAMRLQGITL